MTRKITIDPITRLEGHGQIDIFLDDQGEVEGTYLRVPDFRGFEKFCEGRAAEEMPRLTQKICGVCPTAHHLASTKALDALFGVAPPRAAQKLRELMYHAFIFEDHLLHFFFLGGPDFLLEPGTPREKRNILGVIDKLGAALGKRVLAIRRQVREVNARIGGSALYPVWGLPGGVAKSLAAEDRGHIRLVAQEAQAFAETALLIFQEAVRKNKKFTELLNGDLFSHQTYSMGMVDDSGRLNFCDGQIRVVDPHGREFARFEAADYGAYLTERVESWSYVKLLYLKDIGWQGFTDGPHSGIYRAGPLARLNASEGMATPGAQRRYEELYEHFGGKPVHNILAYHWARLIECLYAAERMTELAADPEITSSSVRNLPTKLPEEGVGACEAPRGTLFHHYQTNSQGMIEKVNLLVATQNSAAAICLSIDKAARAFIHGGKVSEGLLNMIEMAFRAYDPCLACATHCLPGDRPALINLYNKEKKLIKIM
jgi:F420-non-reducing hydrogenase large subunit